MRSARILRWVGRNLVWMMHDEYIRRIADCSEQQETVIIWLWLLKIGIEKKKERERVNR